MNSNKHFIIILLAITSIASAEINLVKDKQLNLIKIIKDLNKELKMEWNAVIALEIYQDMEEVIKSLEIPVIVITDRYEGQTNSLHSQQVMAIVRAHLKESSVVNSFLPSCHSKHILWIMPQASKQDVLALAKKDWYSGHTKSLYYTSQGLFTYHPIPLITIHRIWKIQDYVRSKEIDNFQKFPLVLASLEDFPRAYSYENRAGETVRTGYFYKILKLFIQQYNLQLQEVVYESIDRDAINHGLNNKTLDMMSVPFHMYEGENVTKSDVLWNTAMIIIAPQPLPVPKIKYLQLPYSKGTKISMLLLLFFCAAAVSFLYYSQELQAKIDFSKSILYVLSLFIYQHQINFKIATKLQKLTFFLLFLNGFIFSNIYLAKLSSLFVKIIYEPKINKLEELQTATHEMVMRNVTYEYLAKVPVLQDIIQKGKVKITENTTFFNRELNENYLIIALEDKLNMFLFQQLYLQTPRMYKIKQVVTGVQHFFTLRKNLPYAALFNRYLKYVMESGIFHKLLFESSFDGIRSGQIRFFKDTENEEGFLLTFDLFFGIICGFLASLFLSLIVFILEFMYFKCSK